MTKFKAIALAGVAALTAVTAATPTFARSYNDRGDDYRSCTQQKRENATAGTVMGGLFGAILGASVAGHHDRGTGVVVGALAGAAIGNGVARSSTHCDARYGQTGYGYGYSNGWNNDGYRQDYRYDGRYDNGQYGRGQDDGRYDNGRYDNGRYDNGRGYRPY